MCPQPFKTPNRLVRRSATRIKEIARCRDLLGIDCVKFSPDGKLLAAAKDTEITIMRASSGRTLKTLRGHTCRISAIAWSPESTSLASCAVNQDTEIRLWDVRSGNVRHHLKGHSWYISCVAWSPTGHTVASGGTSDQRVRIWNANTGANTHNLEGFTGFIVDIAFSPSGDLLATLAADHRVRIWRCDDWSQVAQLFETSERLQGGLTFTQPSHSWLQLDRPIRSFGFGIWLQRCCLFKKQAKRFATPLPRSSSSARATLANRVSPCGWRKIAIPKITNTAPRTGCGSGRWKPKSCIPRPSRRKGSGGMGTLCRRACRSRRRCPAEGSVGTRRHDSQQAIAENWFVASRKLRAGDDQR